MMKSLWTNIESNKSQTTIIEMMKKVMKQDQEIERQGKLLTDKDEEIKSLTLVENKNQALTIQVDELTSKHMDLQVLHMELKCSNEKLVESYAILEVAHKVMITIMKSCQPIDNTCSHNSKKERQSGFEQVTVEDCNDSLVQENECGRTNLNYTGSSAQVLSQGLQSYFKWCNPLACRVTSR
jgi:hypothetical protein